ncbi:MAG: sulfite exporter TauE/SafE family protein [Anaerolineales bacterium]|nr:sulfite exporter TauE/SafE family protein [Anaerolineales bacterium]
MHPEQLLAAVLIITLSTLVRSTFGFGDALIAMPLLTLVAGVTVATPLVGLVALTTATTIVIGNWRLIDIKAAWRLIVASLMGIPFGLYLLQTAPESLVKRILGLLLIGFSLYHLTRPQLPHLTESKLAYPFGFVAGILGGAYNTNGPPVVVYGTLRRWPPTHFRATLQGYFLPTSLFIASGHALSGFWTGDVLRTYGWSIPFVFGAIFVGGRLNRRLPVAQFIRILYVVLLILGALLMV